MSRDFQSVSNTDYIDLGLMKLLHRDVSALTGMSGEGQISSGIEGLVYTDLEGRKIYLLSNEESTLLIDFENGTYINLSGLESNYQKLNTTLSLYSSTALSGQGFISYDTFIPMSNFYRGTLSPCKNADEFNTTLQLGTLANQAVITSNSIENESITEDKFDFPFITEEPFKIGDLLYSYRNNAHNGFLLLIDGVTVGNGISGASYANNKYLELFKLLWADNANQIYTSTGTLATRGGSATDDFTNNYRIALPYKTRKFSGAPGRTLAQYTTPITTDINVLVDGFYEITLIGGGGGGSNNFGGAGAGIKTIIKLQKESVIALKVGSGGSGAPPYVRNNDGTNGTASTLTTSGVSITCNGGIRRRGRRNGGTGGNTGTLSYTITNEYEILQRTTDGVETPYSLLGQDYDYAGSGGRNQTNDTGTGYKGKDGYACVKYLGPLPDQEESLKIYNFLSGLSAYIKY